MSFEIYRGIKYNKKTRCFDCSSYSNNVWPKTPNKWTMDYYANEYPQASEQELKALLILGSLYNGDKYYVQWASEYQTIARLWVEKTGTDINYETIKDIEKARELARFYAEYTAQDKKAYVLQNNWGQCITQINRTSYNYGDRFFARVFNARTPDEIKYLNGTKWLIEKAGFMPVEIEQNKQ